MTALTGRRKLTEGGDSVKIFAFLVSKCASGLLLELRDEGKTETQARNAIIHYFLDFAAGEACRVARGEGREPNREKWAEATNGAFDRAVKRTSNITEAGRTALAENGAGQ